MDKELYLALLDCPVLQEYLSTFIGATGILLQFVPAEATGEELLRALRRDSFLAIALRSLKGEAACLGPTLTLCARIRQQLEPAMARHIFGLVHVGLPLRVHGCVPGILLAGPISEKAATASVCLNMAKWLTRCGVRVSLEEVRAAFCAVPFVPSRRLRSALPFLSLLAGHFAETTQSWLLSEREREPHCVVAAKAFIRRNAHNHLSQKEVARQAGVSADHFGRVFRETTHMTCKEYISRVRLEKVKDKLVDPSCRVIEAAFGGGFQSIAQFNRVFKKYVGANPSEYRASIRESFLPGATLRHVGKRAAKSVE